MAEQARHHFRHSSTAAVQDSGDEFRHMSLEPPPWHSRKRLSKQLSMCERRRNIAWEKRRRQILEQERRRNGLRHDHLTDEDLNELKGSIELGFGFTEEDGQSLTHTLPALDLYFAVNRQLSLSSPGSSTPKSLGDRSSSFGSTKSECDSWRICSPVTNVVWRRRGPRASKDQVKALGSSRCLFCDAIHLNERRYRGEAPETDIPGNAEDRKVGFILWHYN